jgi:hypothetical protein
MRTPRPAFLGEVRLVQRPAAPPRRPELGCCGYDELAEKPATTRPISFPRIPTANTTPRSEGGSIARRMWLGQPGGFTPIVPPGFSPITYHAKTNPKSSSPGPNCIFVSHSSPEVEWQDTDIKAFSSIGWTLKRITQGFEYDVWACLPESPPQPSSGPGGKQQPPPTPSEAPQQSSPAPVSPPPPPAPPFPTTLAVGGLAAAGVIAYLALR